MRAELGVGNVDAALSLLERIKARFVTFDFYFFFRIFVLLINRFLLSDNTQKRCITESVGL